MTIWYRTLIGASRRKKWRGSLEMARGGSERWTKRTRGRVRREGMTLEPEDGVNLQQ